MTEAFLSIALAVALAVGVAGVLSEEWDRTRCSVIAFESAHLRLVGRQSSRLSFFLSLGRRPSVRLTESEATVAAEARCGRARERVELVKLEAAEW